MDLLSQAFYMTEKLTNIRHQLHLCPEIGFDLPQTRAIIRKELERLGLNVSECAGGLVAEISGMTNNKTILLRADMDALPIKETSGLPFAALGDACHACGHDLHSTMLLGAADLLIQNRDKLKNKIRFMFQPAEETAQGALSMINQGVLKNVDAAFGIHVAPKEKAGVINCTPGYKTASFDSFKISLKGKGGHGAQPQNTIDPINAAVHIYMGLQSLVSQECEPGKLSILTIGSFHAGNIGNAIPEEAVMEGTCRAEINENRLMIKQRLCEICEGVAGAYHSKAKIDWLAEVPPLFNNPELTNIAVQKLIKSGIDANCETKRINASEDFAFVAQQIPTMYMNIGSGEGSEYEFGNHHPAVRYDETILPIGAAALATCAML